MNADKCSGMQANIIKCIWMKKAYQFRWIQMKTDECNLIKTSACKFKKCGPDLK